MTYYNTNNCSDQLVLEFTSKNQSIEDRIYELFCEVRTPLAWFEVKALLPDFNESSIKRSLSDLAYDQYYDKEKTRLKRKAKLTMLNVTITGSFGKPVHRYKLIE